LKSQVYGLDRYGLKPQDLAGLGEILVYLHGDVHYPVLNTLVEFPPSVRLQKCNSFLRDQLIRISHNWPSGSITFQEKGQGSLSSFKGSVMASDFPRIHRRTEIKSLWIDRIQGRSKSRLLHSHRLAYFSVHGRVAVQIEGRTKGLQTIEDRIVLVRAYSEDDAIERLEREWEEYSQPYLNQFGELVRWKLEEVEDVYEVPSEEIDPKGTEVYISLRSRRMKPEYEWHPRITIEDK
jgi:Domain of unknown function (DUF4288)